MTEFYTEEEAVAAVTGLTRTRLVSFVQAEIVWPVQTAHGPAYRRVDLARMELLCDLSDQFDMHEDALGVVMSLIDQLHGLRADLRSVLTAIGQEPPEVRARLGSVLRRGGGA